MEPRPLLESHFGAWPVTSVASGDFVPLLETPGGGGAAPLNWWRAILGIADPGPGRFVAWIVLAFGLLLTIGTWNYLRLDDARDAHRELAHSADIVAAEISDRLGHYEQALASVAAHRVMGGGRDLAQWVEFVSRLDVERHYPGIQGIAYAAWDPAARTAKIELMYPPNGRVQRMIGFNAYATPVLREALDRAADTGLMALSGRLELILETGPKRQPGFAMYLPDYRTGQPLDSMEQRRAALQGFAYLIFRSHDFVRGALGTAASDVRFALFDGEGRDPERLLYDNLGDGPSRDEDLAAPHLMFPIAFGGRTWTIAVFNPPANGFEIVGRDWALVAGVLMSLILFAMTGALAHSLERRKQANARLGKQSRYRQAYADLGRFALVSGDIDSTIDKAIAVLVEQTGAEYVSLFEHVPADHELVRRAGVGWDSDHDKARLILDEASPAYRSLTTGETVLVRDFQADDRFKFPHVFVKEGIRCTVTALVLDGDTPWGILVASSKRPHSFEADEAVFIQTIAHIIAEALRRRRANELLHQAQKMEAVGQLTGGIAHDFNNLLTVVMGNMELLLDDPSTPAAHRSGMEMTMQAARRGADLTQKMLAFSRRQPLRPQTVELDRTISEMEGLLKRALGDHIEIETHLPRDLWKSHVDSTQLETAILNLAVNARDAMPNGGRLIIEAENAELDETFASTNEIPRVGPYVCLTIADTGSGMAPEVLARVFEPFFTTKEVGKGSGLGLSMVYGFVRQSGGYVKIYSEQDQGTTIRLYLPRAEGEAETAKVRDTKRLVRGNESVLVVEDDPLVRELAVGMIGKLGYEVVVATNGKEALAILDGDGRIDLMFSDLVMPGGISGTELASEALTRRPGIKVLLTSGYSEHTVTKPGEKGISFPLISKPYRASDLAARIRAILDDGKPSLASVA